MCKHIAAPCPACPFSRTVTPGALGGSRPEVFIGQAYGPFLLPCHKACDFSDPDWKRKTIDTPQCAGAAVFRANVGMDAVMPAGIHRLPANKVAVFATAAEFIAHHRQIDIADAKDRLRRCPPTLLARIQMDRTSNINFTNPKAPDAN